MPFLFPPTEPPIIKRFTQASASQVKTFNDCERKWAIEKLAKLKAPETEAQSEGTAIHKILENYVGAVAPIPDTPLGAIAASVVGDIPAPSEDMRPWLEKHFHTPPPTYTVPMVGYIDLVEPDIRRATDYKTKSSLSRYILTSEQLKTDVQAVLYSYEMARQMDWPDVTFRHLNILRTRPRRTSVEVAFTRGELEDRIVIINDTLTRMKAASQAETVLEVEPTGFPQACEKYGGCPFRNICAAAGLHTRGMVLSTILQARNNKENSDMFDMDDLINPPVRQPRPEIEKPAPPQQQQTTFDLDDLASTPPPAEPEPQSAGVEAREALQEVLNLKHRLVTEGGCDQADLNKRPIEELRRMAAELDEAKTEFPDEKLEATSSVAAVTGTVPYYVVVGKAADKKGDFDVIKRYEVKASGLEDALAQARAEENHTSTRGRVLEETEVSVLWSSRTNDISILVTSEATLDQAPAGVTSAASTPHVEAECEVTYFEPPVAEEMQVHVVPQQTFDTLTLYIDCWPNWPVRSIEELLAPLMRAYEKQASLPHYSVQEYAKGDRAVGALLAQSIDDEDLVPIRELRIDTSSPMGARALAIIRERYQGDLREVVGRAR